MLNFANLHLDVVLEKLKSCDVKRAKLIALAFQANGTLITFATNRVVRSRTDRFTIHAEEYLVQKLRKIRAIERFKKIFVLVMRHSKTKGWTMAKPCSRCEGCLKAYGIFDILFTSETGIIQEL